jgi:TolB protein
MKKLTISLILITSCFYVMAQVKSSLEIFNIETDQRTVLWEANDHFEAPNWSPDGEFMIYNSHGRLYKIDMATKKHSQINTGFATRINNDHGISPDGTQIVISCEDVPSEKADSKNWLTSKIYLLPIQGGTPQLVTEKAPSFWHGWSPDGQTLIYTARRNDDFDIYAIDVNGGEEIRLTDDPGLDDGSEFSADGQHIYYNSMQSGKMEIWRMDADGSNKIQLTNDAFSNWFPHPSPDGRFLVYLSYLEDQGASHPPMKKVALRLTDLKNNTTRTLCTFIGGQGTINVPSWSPDSKKFAFVSYQDTQ